MVVCTSVLREALEGEKGEKLGGGQQLGSWAVAAGRCGGCGRLEAAGALGSPQSSRPGRWDKGSGGGVADTRERNTDEKTQPGVQLGAI